MHPIAVILPAYNEALTIAPTIEAFYRELPQAYFVVVNNNSSDDTETIAAQTLINLGAHGQVIRELRQGKGFAVRRAFTDIEAQIYVLADADLTYPAHQVHQLIEPIAQQEADLVVGDRLSKGDYQQYNRRQFHGFGNALVCWLINRLFHANLRDIMTGYRVMSRTFVRNYPILVDGFQIETDMTLYALDKRFRILEISVNYQDRPAGSYSKLNTFTDGTRVLFTIASILRYYRPLLFFGCTALVFALAGLLAAVPVLNDWITERFIHHVPLAILAAGLELVAVMTIGIGLILDAITYQHRLDTETRILQGR